MHGGTGGGGGGGGGGNHTLMSGTVAAISTSSIADGELAINSSRHARFVGIAPSRSYCVAFAVSEKRVVLAPSIRNARRVCEPPTTPA